MTKRVMAVLSFLIIISLGIIIVYNTKEIKRLSIEKDNLILKNDSLHALQLHTKNELLSLQSKMDSTMKQ